MINFDDATWENIKDLNPNSHQSDIDKIYLYAKDPYETKYQLAFIVYSDGMDNIYENINEYNINKNRKISHLMIWLLSNK